MGRRRDRPCRYAAGARSWIVGSGQRADRTDEIRSVQDVMQETMMDRSKLYRRFRTLLIANRGEIACRVIRTARAMGLHTDAVDSEADRDAMHVAMADEAVLLGPARARDSYLNIERVIDAARRSGAEAVHPGYGFLSENADFAQACAEAGLVFVGPTAQMMTAMGSKSGSKALMEKAGVPLVPGYHGEAQEEAVLARQAERIGFPVLL